MRIPAPGSVVVVAGRWRWIVEPTAAGAEVSVEAAAANPWLQPPPVIVAPLDRQEARSLGEALLRMAERLP